MHYRAVVFDLDGVLTETSRAHFKAWQELAESLGFTLEDEVEDHVRGISRMASLEIVLEAGGKASDFDQEQKVEMATRKNERYLELIKEYTAEELSPGAKELLAYLKGKGKKIALASASANGPFLLDAMGIMVDFDAIVDPTLIPNGKPAPDIFAKACELLNVKPNECFGVEDAYAGVESIKAAGLYPIGVGSKELLTNCEMVFDDLQGVLTYLKSFE